jgi:hypothetical protein
VNAPDDALGGPRVAGSAPRDADDSGDRPFPEPPGASALVRLPLTVDLRPLLRATRLRRAGWVATLLIFAALLVAAWTFDLLWWTVYRGFANGITSIAVVGVLFLAPAGYLVWKARSGTTRAMPTSLSVTAAGFTLFYAGGDYWNLQWSDPRADAWMTDVTGTDAYPSWVPSGFYLGEPSTVTGRFWIPEEAYAAIMASARAAGARVSQWEARRSGLHGPAEGTLVYRLRGRPASGDSSPWQAETPMI